MTEGGMSENFPDNVVFLFPQMSEQDQSAIVRLRRKVQLKQLMQQSLFNDSPEAPSAFYRSPLWPMHSKKTVSIFARRRGRLRLISSPRTRIDCGV